MANLIFYTDYGPLICRAYKSAFVLYCYYDKFKNDDNEIHLTYEELGEHLGLATTTISNSLRLLEKLNLIQQIESGYRLLDIEPLTEQMKKDILLMTQKEDYNEATSIRNRFLLSTPPSEFQQLLIKKDLKKAAKDCQKVSVDFQLLAEYFNIDYDKLMIHLARPDSDTFKKKLMETIEEVCGEKQNNIKTKRAKVKERFGDNEKNLAKYLYDKLVERDAKPIDPKWWVKNCSIAHDIMSKGVSPVEAINMIDWCCADNFWKDKIDSLSVLNTVHSKYKMQKNKVQLQTSNTGRYKKIPQQVQAEIKQISNYEIETYNDAQLLRQSVIDGENDSTILQIIDILKKNNIIILDSQNLNFG